jgi:DNA-binding PadR family transcriptional regulator
MRNDQEKSMKNGFYGRRLHFGERSMFARGPFGKGGHGAFGGEGPGGSSDRGRGGRRRRLFDQIELQTLLLALIAEQPRHGYDLIREIESISGGEYAPSPGIVYPALTFMEEQGVIAPNATDGGRKAFAVTEEGARQASGQAEVAALLRQRLTSLAVAREKTDPAPVRRAMHSMKTALFDRLTQEDVSRETVLALAEIIDEAARKIERIEA